MVPKFHVEQLMLAKTAISTEAGSGAWGDSVVIAMILITICSNAIAHRWSVHHAL